LRRESSFSENTADGCEHCKNLALQIILHAWIAEQKQQGALFQSNRGAEPTTNLVATSN